MTYKSKFGFGCMRLPLINEKEPSSINQELFNEIVDIYLKKKDLITLIHLMHIIMVQVNWQLKKQ